MAVDMKHKIDSCLVPNFILTHCLTVSMHIRHEINKLFLKLYVLSFCYDVTHQNIRTDFIEKPCLCLALWNAVFRSPKFTTTSKHCAYHCNSLVVSGRLTSCMLHVGSCSKGLKQGSDIRVRTQKKPARFFWVHPPKNKPTPKNPHFYFNLILVCTLYATNNAIFYCF